MDFCELRATSKFNKGSPQPCWDFEMLERPERAKANQPRCAGDTHANTYGDNEPC